MIFAKLLVKMIAPRVRVRKSREGCEFEFGTSTLFYDDRQTAEDVGFMRHLAEKHHFPEGKRYSDRLWSILHELGHYYNPDAECDFNGKALCAVLCADLAKTSRTLQNLYYDSPDEFEATEWAIDWITRHPVLARIYSVLL